MSLRGGGLFLFLLGFFVVCLFFFLSKHSLTSALSSSVVPYLSISATVFDSNISSLFFFLLQHQNFHRLLSLRQLDHEERLV